MEKLRNKKWLWDIDVTFLVDRSSATEEPKTYQQNIYATYKVLEMVLQCIEQAHLVAGGSVVETKVKKQS